MAVTIFSSLERSITVKIIYAFIFCPCVRNVPHIYTLFYIAIDISQFYICVFDVTSVEVNT